jgi:hypothetical protein
MKVDTTMAGLDELFAQIPVADIANKIGADQGEVNNAIKTLVPALVGGLAENVQSNEIDSSKIESATAKLGGSDLLDGGVSVDQVDETEGNNLVASLFGGNDSNAVASALAGTGAGGSGLIQKLLPILAPIVLAYIGKQLANRGGGGAAQPQAQAQSAGGGGLGDILGGILGGAGGGGGNNPLGSILGSVMGGGQNNAIGEILGGLLGGKK